MKKIASTMCAAIAVVFALTTIAEARSYRSGRTYGFARSHCKTSSCYSKHPGGTWVHPLTRRKHR